MEEPPVPTDESEEKCTFCFSFNRNQGRGEHVFYDRDFRKEPVLSDTVTGTTAAFTPEDVDDITAMQGLRVIRTANLKGHRERMAAMYWTHQKSLTDAQQVYLVSNLLRVAIPIFEQFKDLEHMVVLDSTNSRFSGHYHPVACELNPSTQDYQKIIEETRVLAKIRLRPAYELPLEGSVVAPTA